MRQRLRRAFAGGPPVPQAHVWESAVAKRVADADPVYLECILDARGVHVDVVAQGIPQALGDYDTTLIHVVQTYIYPGPANGVLDRNQLPHPISGIGTKAAWIAMRSRSSPGSAANPAAPAERTGKRLPGPH